jgi:F0F1-type ATP synthase membrane subunit b/b'
MRVLVPQFDSSFYFSQGFWLILIFSFMYLIISKYIVPKGNFIIYNRKSNIDDNLEKADFIQKEILSLKSNYDLEIKKAKSDANEILRKTVKDIEIEFEKQKSLLTLETKKNASIVINEMNLKHSKLKNEGAESCIEIAGLIIKKVTGIKVDTSILKEYYSDL